MAGWGVVTVGKNVDFVTLSLTQKQMKMTMNLQLLVLKFECRYFESFVILTILANCVFLVVECAPDEAE